MIDPDAFSLSTEERLAIASLLAEVGPDPSLEQLWWLMDQAWEDCRCDNRHVNTERYASFYRHPVWLLNGMFIEQHSTSMGHRRAITAAVAALRPEHVVDVGGGFGTLARLLASALPKAQIHICEPYPPQHGIVSCQPYANIQFVPELTSEAYDVLVSTDVLEHVPDALALLAHMVKAVRPGGHLLIANCFHPVIQCHLPCTFHLRHSFDSFCRELGLDVLGPCAESHATIYRRSRRIEPDWPRLRALEHRSQALFPWRAWHDRHVLSWRKRARLLATRPLHYPGKLLAALRPTR